LLPFAFDQDRIVNPNPHIRQVEPDYHEQQPDDGLSGANADPPLTHLTTACFDAETKQYYAQPKK